MLSAVSSLKWTDWAYPTKQIPPKGFFSPKEKFVLIFEKKLFLRMFERTEYLVGLE